MLLAKTLERVFLFKDKDHDLQLADPSDNMQPQDALNFYANTYPILTTAKIVGPEIKNDRVEYRFETTMGTKG